MSLIIKVNDLIQAPDDNNPVLPDLSSGLYFDFDARSLTLSEGASVNSWVAAGSAPLANRSLNYVRSGAFEAPTFSKTAGPNGGPTVVFNTESSLMTAPDQPSLYEGDLTIAVVAKAATISGNYARFYQDPISLPNGSATTIRPSPQGNIVITTSFKTNSRIVPNPGNDFVCVLSRNSSSEVSMFGSESDVTNVTGGTEGLPANQGLNIGTSRSVSTPDGFDGSITRIIMYSRALTAIEVRALVGSLKLEYGI